MAYQTFQVPKDHPLALALADGKRQYQAQIPAPGQRHPIGGERVVTGGILMRTLLQGLAESPEARSRVLSRYPETSLLLESPATLVDKWEEVTQGARGPFGYLTCQFKPVGCIICIGGMPARLAPPEWPVPMEHSILTGMLGEALASFRLHDRRPRTGIERQLQEGLKDLRTGLAAAVGDGENAGTKRQASGGETPPASHGSRGLSTATTAAGSGTTAEGEGNGAGQSNTHAAEPVTPPHSTAPSQGATPATGGRDSLAGAPAHSQEEAGQA